MTNDLIHATAAELAAKIHSGEISSVEVTQAHLDRIVAVDPDVRAFLHVAGVGAPSPQVFSWVTFSRPS